MMVRIGAAMSNPLDGPATLLLPGPRPTHCLEFVNTLAWRGRARPEESLHDLADLVAWLAGAGLGSEAVEALRGWSEEDPAGAPALLDSALALRETLAR